jgi:hypothetical protein
MIKKLLRVLVLMMELFWAETAKHVKTFALITKV